MHTEKDRQVPHLFQPRSALLSAVLLCGATVLSACSFQPPEGGAATASQAPQVTEIEEEPDADQEPAAAAEPIEDPEETPEPEDEPSQVTVDAPAGPDGTVGIRVGGEAPSIYVEDGDGYSAEVSWWGSYEVLESDVTNAPVGEIDIFLSTDGGREALNTTEGRTNKLRAVTGLELFAVWQDDDNFLCRGRAGNITPFGGADPLRPVKLYGANGDTGADEKLCFMPIWGEMRQVPGGEVGPGDSIAHVMEAQPQLRIRTDEDTAEEFIARLESGPDAWMVATVTAGMMNLPWGDYRVAEDTTCSDGVGKPILWSTMELGHCTIPLDDPPAPLRANPGSG